MSRRRPARAAPPKRAARLFRRRSRPRCSIRSARGDHRQRPLARAARMVQFTPQGPGRGSRRPKSRGSRFAPGRRALRFAAKPAAGRSTAWPPRVPAELASHIDIGLRLHACQRAGARDRRRRATAASFAEFGLDPPASVVVLGAAHGPVATVEFRRAQSGRHVAICPPRRSPHGLSDAAACRHRVASRGRHGAPVARAGRAAQAQAAGRACCCRCRWRRYGRSRSLPRGKLTRFERDSAGNWFRHVGQHSHAANANAHVADPAQARIIAAALDAFDRDRGRDPRRPRRRCRQLAQFGLAFPPVIVLLYARDSSTALARVEFGGAADSLDRYARLAPDGDVVTVAEFEVKRLTELLKAVGAGREPDCRCERLASGARRCRAIVCVASVICVAAPARPPGQSLDGAGRVAAGSQRRRRSGAQGQRCRSPRRDACLRRAEGSRRSGEGRGRRRLRSPPMSARMSA